MFGRVLCTCGATLDMTGEGPAFEMTTCPSCGNPIGAGVINKGAEEDTGFSAGFALLPEPPRRRLTPAEIAERERRVLLCQIDLLTTNTMRSIQALDTKLRADERDGILRTLELAKANRKCGTEALQATLRDLESAAAIVGRAMLRT